MYQTIQQKVQKLTVGAIDTLKKEFQKLKWFQVYRSSCSNAVIGAEIIEKHFTFDKNADGQTTCNLNFDEMKSISSIRQYEKMIGHGKKYPLNRKSKI